MSFVEIHPENPQTRLVDRVVDVLNTGGLVAIPTDSGYALACVLGNKSGIDRIRAIRRLDEKHNYSLLCDTFARLGDLVIMDNSQFRAMKASTPGPYTFILPGTKEVPRMTLNKKKHTIGVRIPEHRVVQAILSALGQPLVASSLILPGQSDVMSDGFEVDDKIGSQVDLVVVAPVGGDEATSVIDYTDGSARIARRGAGDLSLWE